MSSFLFIGTKAARVAAARQYAVEKLGVSLEQNPDVYFFLQGDVKIADAENVRSRAAQMPFGKAAVFFIDIERATSAAQNALLKVLEEPAQDTHFVCMVPSKTVLLPTVLSRLHEVFVGSSEDGEQGADDAEVEQARAFLSGTPKERASIVQRILKVHDRIVTKAFVDALEELVYNTGDTEALREVALVQRYVKDNGSSSKLLLEHLLVVLPRVAGK